jgi:hypothetical protein
MASGKLLTLVKLITRGKAVEEVHRALNVAQLTRLPWHPQNCCGMKARKLCG